MSAPVGGSIEHVTIGNRLFAVAADADATINLGGDTNEIQPNGDRKTSRMIKTVNFWAVGGLAVSINDSNRDQEFLQDIADGNVYEPFTVKMASGVVYQGTGTVTEAVERSSQSATATVSFGGEGKLTQQG